MFCFLTNSRKRDDDIKLKINAIRRAKTENIANANTTEKLLWRIELFNLKGQTKFNNKSWKLFLHFYLSLFRFVRN